jgi:hypothetical protein
MLAADCSRGLWHFSKGVGTFSRVLRRKCSTNSSIFNRGPNWSVLGLLDHTNSALEKDSIEVLFDLSGLRLPDNADVNKDLHNIFYFAQHVETANPRSTKSTIITSGGTPLRMDTSNDKSVGKIILDASHSKIGNYFCAPRKGAS